MEKTFVDWFKEKSKIAISDKDYLLGALIFPIEGAGAYSIKHLGYLHYPLSLVTFEIAKGAEYNNLQKFNVPSNFIYEMYENDLLTYMKYGPQSYMKIKIRENIFYKLLENIIKYSININNHNGKSNN